MVNTDSELKQYLEAMQGDLTSLKQDLSSVKQDVATMKDRIMARVDGWRAWTEGSTPSNHV